MSYRNTKHTSSNCHGSYKTYVIVFFLSIILTIIPFAMVMNSYLTKKTLMAVLVICAVVQIGLHLIFFLHLNTSSEQQWNLIALFFTVLIITILVVGSLWIMWHLNLNLMS
ncbi:cytochrome o ubiquinol oxidase subunit IV [Candidatus Palibaumannia cicadellinicola]|uniref:Cytochrome bo(3) ubiquinol oxidase subunit 4 n=1 Tax=Candidatus Palibaumannia cicadellinicola TaxID=186490 RepID=A0A2N4XWE9_9GAMM|nr:cytochrome o ubiquinol oxidase subunit IV [Candidatus Baumannia cicadellinicola]PLK58393.1 cytochrome o ubiquinol oxidase subunit IV [Candidatus Baumannia cicadellinicola]